MTDTLANGGDQTKLSREELLVKLRSKLNGKRNHRVNKIDDDEDILSVIQNGKMTIGHYKNAVKMLYGMGEEFTVKTSMMTKDGGMLFNSKMLRHLSNKEHVAFMKRCRQNRQQKIAKLIQPEEKKIDTSTGANMGSREARAKQRRNQRNKARRKRKAEQKRKMAQIDEDEDDGGFINIDFDEVDDSPITIDGSFIS